MRCSCATAGLILLLAAAATPAREQGRAKLPPGLVAAFIVPGIGHDQYANPVVTRGGSTFEPATSWPYEVWLREPRMEFVLVLPGDFEMGLDRSKYSAPAHRARITKPFYSGKYEVTQAQWQQVMRAKPWWLRRDITVRHLLLHQGGWDRGKTFGPMGISGTTRVAKALGVPMPPTPAHIIRYMMGRPLQFTPGAESKYSNFGYILLGRVIEEVTGQTYEGYVKQHVLAPLGIRTMQIGQTAQEDLAPNEVHYGRERKITASFGPHKGKPVVVAYARCIPVMDANGGWIASAVDLMRFAAAFDDPARCPILSEESIKKMFARPDDVNGFDADGNARPTYYAFGWGVKPNGLGQLTTSHGGGMEGTSTGLVRRHDGVNWAILFSCYGSPHARGALRGLIGESLHVAADSVRDWPDQDLFSKLE